MKIRDELLEMRAKIDRILSDLPTEQAEASVSRYMKVTAYARRVGLSARTIREYCELGMPHEGEGHNRRVLVAEADAWLVGGGPRRARVALRLS